MPSRSCFFHWLIWTGWTWYALASSATVLVCLAASRATLALKAAECRLRCASHDAPRDGTVTFDQFNIPSCPVLGVHYNQNEDDKATIGTRERFVGAGSSSLKGSRVEIVDRHQSIHMLVGKGVYAGPCVAAYAEPSIWACAYVANVYVSE